jgi:hypothetical protein
MKFLKASAAAIAAIGALVVAAPSAAAATTCTWAGTALNPTGTFTITPGVTNLPSSGPLEFVASGALAGGRGCHGTMTWIGDLATGATCPFSKFEGRVYGLPGVYRFEGYGSLDAPSRLFDRYGRQVGQENAEILTPANQPRLTDCTTPGGFHGGWPGMFSSLVMRF